MSEVGNCSCSLGHLPVEHVRMNSIENEQLSHYASVLKSMFYKMAGVQR